MKNNGIVIYVVFGLLAVAVLIFFVLNRDSGKHFQWYESYNASSDQPYGTLYLKNLLQDYHPKERFTFNDKKPLADILLAVSDVPTDYIFVGNSFYLSALDRIALLEFIKKGNDALIASRELPPEFASAIFDDSCKSSLKFISRSESSVTMNFLHDSLKLQDGISYAKRIATKYFSYDWRFLDSSDSCRISEVITPLGNQSQGEVNFFKVEYGKGTLFFHTDPLVFTNYFLAKKDHLPYAEGVLSHLTGTDIIWDEFSKLPEQKERGKSSPLYYILQQPSLKYAWWMLLATVVLYVVFAAKRKQRVIPVLEKKVNISLEYIRLISTLHFRNGNPLDMARKKMRYFLYFIRSKYGIQVQPFGPDHIALLALKSTVPEEEVKVIFDRYTSIENNAYYNSQADKLLGLFYSIENFMAKCR